MTVYATPGQVSFMPRIRKGKPNPGIICKLRTEIHKQSYKIINGNFTSNTAKNKKIKKIEKLGQTHTNIALKGWMLLKVFGKEKKSPLEPKRGKLSKKKTEWEIKRNWVHGRSQSCHYDCAWRLINLL